MNHCQYGHFCRKKSKFGSYCTKHRRYYLINDDQMINIERFTGNEKDYLKKDIIRSLDKFKFNYKSQSKTYLFTLICKYINNLKFYEKNVHKIKIIQALFRGKHERHKFKMKKCNNTEDFYTYELIRDIPDKYFYSYKDLKDFVWGFDIRSFEKLISMHYPNPYTTEVIPDNIINDFQKKLLLIKKRASYEDLTDIIERDRGEIIKQRIVDLCLSIEQSGFPCMVEWITLLNIRKLKELYKQLEDVWNYRAQLSNEIKCRIIPPNGRIFNIPVSEVLSIQNIFEIQELILNEINKFTNTHNESDKRLGYMYFIIGLSHVSRECYLCHQDWIAFIN